MCSINFNNNILRESNRIRYLGVIIDPLLSWQIHISELCKKLSRAVGLLNKIKLLCQKKTLKDIYYSIFHSHLSYGIEIWGAANKNLIKRLIFLQKKAIRIVSKADYLANTKPLFLENKILKVDNLFFSKIMGLMWDYHHGFLPNALCYHFRHTISHQYETRVSKKGKLNSIRFNTIKFGKKLYNKMQDDNIFGEYQTKKSFLKSLKSGQIIL